MSTFEKYNRKYLIFGVEVLSDGYAWTWAPNLFALGV